MKKTMIIIVGIIAAILMVGCGSEVESTPKFTGEFEEEFFVEDIIIEDLVREDIINEDKYIDGEYERELEFNSRTNEW